MFSRPAAAARLSAPSSPTAAAAPRRITVRATAATTTASKRTTVSRSGPRCRPPTGSPGSAAGPRCRPPTGSPGPRHSPRLSKRQSAASAAARPRTSPPKASAAAAAASALGPVAAAAEIGSGGFGTVFSPAFENTNFTNATNRRNSWVTKIYFDESKYVKAVQNIPVIERLGLPYGAHPYKRPLRISHNVPIASRRQMQTKMIEDEIYGIRMPHRGQSIDDVIVKSLFTPLRNIPVHVIFTFMCNMLVEVNRLVDNRYIHGDLRAKNVTVDPRSGVFTIIDFDWFYEKSEFFDKYYNNFGFFSNPPETLLASGNPTERADYITFFQQEFCDHPMLQAIDAINRENRIFLRNLSPSRRIEKDIRIWDKTLDTFDSFGLAWTLLRLFRVVYPGSLENDVEMLKVSLKTRITNNGMPYSDEEFVRYAVAINSFVQMVLLPMGNFNVERRLSARDGLAQATAILRGAEPV